MLNVFCISAAVVEGRVHEGLKVATFEGGHDHEVAEETLETFTPRGDPPH
jgi:hypothetical protein